MKQRWIGLLDCNNFFVSCERLFRPDLVKIPVVVLSSNDGCIVARSQEVKDIGVPMGVPYFQVKDSLKDIGTVSFSSNFTLYRDVSRRVFAVMREELNTIEQYSIDEAFFTVNDDPLEVSRRIKKAVERQVGIPVSVGVAASKTQAKYAASKAKKELGVCVLDNEAWKSEIPNIPLAKIWGVGGGMELRYKQHGLITVHDFLQADVTSIQKLFGVGGVRLRRELEGQPIFTVSHSLQQQKSLISSRSFNSSVLEYSVLADAVAYHVRHAAADLRAMSLKTNSLQVSIRPGRHSDFFLRGGSKEAILSNPTNDTILLLQTAMKLLQELYEPGVPYKKAGITCNHLVSAEIEQKTLFCNDRDHTELLRTVDTVNQRFGNEALLLGSRLRNEEWQSRKDLRSPGYTTQWQALAKARA